MRVSQPSTAVTSIGPQLLIVALAGLILLQFLVWAPPFLTVAAVLGAVLGLIFLRRPDIGLGIVLLVRASTDVLLRSFPVLTGGVRSLFMNPNVGLILILIVGGGLFILAKGVPFLSLPGGRLFALLLLTGLIGVIRSDKLINSMNNWLPPVSSLIVYALASHSFRTPARIQMMLTLIALSFLGPALLGFRQIMSGTAQFYGGADLMRTFGTFVGPSAFGVYLVTILAIFVVQALTRTGRSRLWPLLIVVSAVVLLVQTFSRSAWVGAIVVILTIGLLKERRLLILLPLAIVVAYVWVPEIALRLQNPLGGTYLHRTEIWRGSYETWLTLTSLGGGFLPTLMDRLSGLGPGARYLLSYVSVGRTFGTHNDYLALLFDYGIMGLLFYLLMIFTLLFAAYRAWRQSRHDLTLGAVPLSFLALALAYMAMSAVDNIFGMTVNQVYFWSLAGLTVAVSGLSAGEGVPGPEHAGAMPGDNRGPADMISRASVRSSLLH